MKIAVFHELPHGGARRAVNGFAKYLSKNNTVDIYYTDEHADDEIAIYPMRTYFYQFTPVDWKGNDWRKRLYKDTIELFSIYILHKAIANDMHKHNYDFVFIHPSKFTQSPFLLRFLTHKKVYYCQEPLRIVYDSAFVTQNKNFFSPRQVYELLTKKMLKYIDSVNIKRSDVILANSHYTQLCIKNGYQLEAQVCYLGIDIFFFKPLNIQKEYDVLFIGEKVPIEGFDLFIESLKKLKKKPKVKVISRKQGLFSISDKELIKEYNKSKIVVALSHNEPFGLIPLEAMACGVPVVAVNEGGYKESVINGKTGFLVGRDPRMAAQKIKLLLSNNSLAEKTGRNAREHIIKNWTWEKSVEHLEIIMKNFLSSKQ